MDFGNLAIAPLAAITTIVVIGVAMLADRYSEPKSAILAFCCSVGVTTLLDQPWLYANWTAMLSGIEMLLLLDAFGFAVGALLILTPVKLLNR